MSLKEWKSIYFIVFMRKAVTSFSNGKISAHQGCEQFQDKNLILVNFQVTVMHTFSQNKKYWNYL